jgi:hypothetical protein
MTTEMRDLWSTLHSRSQEHQHAAAERCSFQYVLMRPIRAHEFTVK